MKTPSLIKKTSIALAACVACTAGFAQTTPDLVNELKQLREELRVMHAELDALKKQQSEPSAGTMAVAPLAQQPSSSFNGPSVVAATPSGARIDTPAAPQAPANAVSLFGYGELYYTNYLHNVSQTTASAARGVLGMSYRFNDRTRFASELEIENAVVSQGDQGEAAFEQLYIEHDIDDQLSAKIGLFLMPVGYMNETHEPTHYYGVTRNLVETAIIPSTWRELGVGLQKTTDEGMRWNAGMVTSFNLSKWTTASSADTAASPLAALHQEGQLAKAASLGYYGAVNYDGIPGFNVGGSVFAGGIGQKQTDIATPNASVTLAEAHAKWQVGAWDLSTVAAQGQFHGVAAFNAATAAANPVPDQFRGWYAQAAYRLWHQGDYSLVPFGRYERVNTALGFSGLPQGVTPANAPDTRVMTLGASYYLHPQVVLKMDAQRYFNNTSLDRINMGVGFQY
jgi:hypothetical protein